MKHSKQKNQGPGPETGSAKFSLQGSTSRHTDNTKVASVGTPGNSAPGKHKRGAQG